MDKKAFSVIELIMVIVIIGILSVSGAWLMVYFVQNSVYAPNQLNTDMVANEALKIMVEGDNTAKGLRFSGGVTGITNNNNFTFTNQAGQNINYTLNTVTNILYRSINGGPQAQIPYYPGISILGQSGSLFTFYDVNGNVTATPANVRWIAINLIAETGNGAFNSWEGQSTQSTSIAVY